MNEQTPVMTKTSDAVAADDAGMTVKAGMTPQTGDLPPLSIDPDQDLGPLDILAVARGGRTVTLSETTRTVTADCRHFLQDQVDQNIPIYGITTGFGPLANHFLTPSLSLEVQKNLIYHLASGVGPALPYDVSRAMLLIRLKTLSFGKSGVRPELLDHLASVLNAGLAPYVPEMGTVGASGDLTPLSHVALALMGEGEFITPDGTRRDASLVLADHDIAPLTLAEKEGLGLVNGTAAMTAIAALNDARMAQRFADALDISVAIAEIFGAESISWSERVGHVRPHDGQQALHRLLCQQIASSDYMRDETSLRGFHDLPDADMPAGNGEDGSDNGARAHAAITVLPVAPQSPYSLRCIPQLYGALLEQLWAHNRVVTREIGSVTDNPLCFPDEGVIAHAGNFFGHHIAVASDTLTMACASIATHLDRCLARITDPRTNEGLPAFLTGGVPGQHSGFMGAQVTATAVTAEIRSGVIPVSTQSLPTNGNNQDIVPLGTIAARKVKQHLFLLDRVVAISALAATQAMDLKAGEKPLAGYSDQTQALYAHVRKFAKPLSADMPLSQDIETLATNPLNSADSAYARLLETKQTP